MSLPPSETQLHHADHLFKKTGNLALWFLTLRLVFLVEVVTDNVEQTDKLVSLWYYKLKAVSLTVMFNLMLLLLALRTFQPCVLHSYDPCFTDKPINPPAAQMNIK